MRAKHSLTLLLDEYIWREVQFINQIIMLFSVAYCFSLRPTYIYRADKSLPRTDWKSNWKVAIFRPPRRSLLPRRPGWMDNLLNCFWVACKS